MKTCHASVSLRLLLVSMLFAGLTACDRPQIDPNVDSLVKLPALSKPLGKDAGKYTLPRPGALKWDSILMNNPTDTILVIPADRPKIDPQPVQVFIR